MTRLLVRADEQGETVGIFFLILVKHQLQDSLRAFGGLCGRPIMLTNRFLAPTDVEDLGKIPASDHKGYAWASLF
jgi:hypothetical protein